MKFESFSIIFLIQSYLMLVSLTNVSTPRYLMPIYPILVILSIKFITLLQKIMKNNLNLYYNDFIGNFT